MDRIEDNPLVIMSEMEEAADWLRDANAFVLNEEYERATRLVAKIIAEKGNVPQPKVAALMVELQALATVMRVQFAAYMSYYKGTENANAIKNHYKELYSGVDRLVDTLKYLVRS